MVPIKNATVQVYRRTQTQNAAGVLKNPTKNLAGQADVYFEEATPVETYEAIGVALEQAVYVMAEIEDRGLFAPNCILVVTMDGQEDVYGTYFMYGTVEQHLAANDADHLDIYASKSQHPS